MIKLLSILLLTLSLNALEYYSKVEPIEEFHIKSSLNGEVKYVAVEKEGRVSDGGLIVKIDDKLDKKSLSIYQEKLEISRETLLLLEDQIKNAKKVMQIAKDNYMRVKNLQSYTKVQKDAKLSSYLSAKSNFIQLKNSLLQQKSIREDLKDKIENLKDRIEKKSIRVKNGYFIYAIYPRKGDFVNVGSKLIDCYDINHAKLTLFISRDDLESIKSKTIYLDGKKTDYKIDKLWKVADSKNISSYKAEIVIDKPTIFSKLIKVEFK